MIDTCGISDRLALALIACGRQNHDTKLHTQPGENTLILFQIRNDETLS